MFQTIFHAIIGNFSPTRLESGRFSSHIRLNEEPMIMRGRFFELFIILRLSIGNPLLLFFASYTLRSIMIFHVQTENERAVFIYLLD